MADLATLGIVAKMTGVNEAASGLDSLSDSANKADVSAKKVGSSFTNLSGPLAALKVAFAGAVAAAGLGSFSSIADDFSDLSSRVGIAVRSMEKAPAVMERIAQTANMTYSSLQLTAEGFVRNATVLRELGKSTQQQLDYQEALNNALVVSGAKGRQAEFVQESLNRSMALGAMRGIELNNVLNYGGRIAELLADHFDTTTGGLMRMAQEGKITAAVLYDVLYKNMTTLREEAEEMPATIGDAFLRMRNNITSYVGTMDQASGASGALAEVLLSVADNVDRIIVTVGTAVTAFGVYYVGALSAAAIATAGLSGALTLLRRALIATGIGALVVAAGELVYQLLEARKASNSWWEAFQLVAGRIKLLYEGLKWTFYALVDGMRSAWASAMSYILKSTQDTFGPIARILGLTFGGFGEVIDNLKQDASDFAANAGDQLVIAGEKFTAAFEKFDSGALADLSGDGGAAVKVLGEVDKAAKRASDAYARIVLAAKERLEQMELEEQLVGKNGVAADVLRMKLDMLYEAKRKGLKLEEPQIKYLNSLADAYGKVAERVAGLQLMEEARFERSQLFRSPIDAAIASDLRNAGIEMDSVAGQAYASFKKTTEQISIAKDEVKSFASGFISDILNGKSAIEALGGALQKLGDKLIDMALDQAINGLFGNLAGLFGGGGGGGIGALSGQFAASGGIGLFAKGGVSDEPAIFGEAGPEAAVPLPDGRSIPVTLNSGVGSEAVGETYAPVYNFSGTSEEFKQFKQFVLERDKQFNARAVNAVNKGSKKNAIRV